MLRDNMYSTNNNRDIEDDLNESFSGYNVRKLGTLEFAYRPHSTRKKF
jgi:hypothetical protein